ncbi:bifunctional hydroxymethylpyrimidine kinase/phosphomethylpyrimidine kinase [soil metagenome]
MSRPPVVLTVAGSDPSGGAGIQADLKTFSALRTYGCAVLTSLTAQNTTGVTGIHPVPAPFVTQQISTLFDDVEVDSMKIGMLGSAQIAEAVHASITEVVTAPVVLDPVMVSTSGSALVDEDATEAIRRLLAVVTVVTPNLHEAAVLLGTETATDLSTQVDQARALRELGAPRVLLKGGHGTGAEATDVWVDADQTVVLRAPRLDTMHTHGTGCTLSAALAALYPQHQDWLSAARAAKTWLTGALEAGADLHLGKGSGPVHHFYDMWK